MKKCFIMLILFVAVFVANVSSQSAPVKSGNWQWSDGGQIADTLGEKSGNATVEGKKLKYWLYNTHNVGNNIKDNFILIFLPTWLQSLGYSIDYKNSHIFYPNDALASSVRDLMKKNNANVSVSLIEEKNAQPYFVINIDLGGNTYKTIVYYLLQGSSSGINLLPLP